MRSDDLIPENPWPQDMVLRIETNANALLELLWVREAWELHPVGDVPPLLVKTPIRLGRADHAAEWEDAWPGIWQSCIRHIAREPVPHLVERLHNTADGSPERADLIRTHIGPRWRDRFGEDAFDESFFTWQQDIAENLGGKHSIPLEANPEHRVLDALIQAWERGLAQVITIPCKGEYSRSVEASALLMTENTRETPVHYAAALSTFP